MLASVVVCTVLIACAPNGGLAVEDLERDLTALTLPEYPGLVSAVVCPDPLAPEPGDVVVCEVTIGSQQAPLEVTFGDERGEVLRAEVLARLVVMSDVERTVAAELTSDLAQATKVRCPQAVMVVPAGDSVQCVTSDARGVEREILVTPNDDGSTGVRFGR